MSGIDVSVFLVNMETGPQSVDIKRVAPYCVSFSAA